MYAVLLVPGLNILPPFGFFLFLHFLCNRVNMAVLGRMDRKGKERKVSISHPSGQSTDLPSYRLKKEEKQLHLLQAAAFVP
jgi:hypothetical protein